MSKKCDACGLISDVAPMIYVRTTNGGLSLCRQCLDDINRKNPALEVMARRGWAAFRHPGNKKWYARFDSPGFETILAREDKGYVHYHDNPLAALVAADCWYAEHVEQW